MKEFDNAREELREQAKQQIAKVQEENQRSYNKKKKSNSV